MRHAFRFRLRLLLYAVFFCALLLVGRLGYVQIVEGADYASQAERQYENDSDTLYDRGAIYFTNKDGTLISAATLATGYLVAINPTQVKDPDAAYAALAASIDLDRDAFMAHAAKKNDPYEVIADQISEAAGQAISEADIPGVILIHERWRVYPAGTEAAQTIGIVGQAANDTALKGRYGLERSYDAVLARDGAGLFGNFFAQLFADVGEESDDSEEQGDVITSIEPVVEEKLDQVLEEVDSQYRSEVTGGIIMDPATGAIIALDTAPSFDPNDLSNADISRFGNPLVERRYEFGSIVKALTMAAGLDAGAVAPDTTYYDTGCITVNTAKICNYDFKARGTIPMQQILTQSLNVGASWVATKLGHAPMLSYFSSLGLDTKTGIDLPSEISGTIENLRDPGLDVNFDTASFGQGIAATPVEMIRALGALANHGAIVSPHIAVAVRHESGAVETLPVPEPVQVFKPSTAATVTNMLVSVVDTAFNGGTYNKDMLMPEMAIAAKTGTAQIAAPGGGYYADQYLHSFFGYFPANNPRFVILLYTVKPQGVEYASGTMAAPFFELAHFLTNYYNIPPDRAQYETPS